MPPSNLTLSVQQLQALLDAPASLTASEPPGFPDPVLSRWKPEAQFSITSIEPPSANYLQKTEVLQLAIWNAVAGINVQLTGRWLRPDGSIGEILENLIPTSNRVQSTLNIALGEGFLLNLSVRVETGAVLHGQCYGRVLVVSATGFATANLISGYLSSLAPIFWPGGKVEQPGDGTGVLRAVSGTNPLAGVEQLETVPTNARWRLRSYRAQLVTDATVATRIARFYVVYAAGIDHVMLPSKTQAASLGITYEAFDNIPDPATQATEAYWKIPADLSMPAGATFGTSTTLLKAGDNWGAPIYLVEEWIDI